MPEVPDNALEPQKTAVLHIMPILSPTPSERHRLPNRRECHIETLEVAGQTFSCCIGFDPETGQPRELFLDSSKQGSQVDALLSDAATAISVALQFGVPPSALAKSIGRLPNLPITPADLDRSTIGGQPASPVGAAIDLLCRATERQAAQ